VGRSTFNNLVTLINNGDDCTAVRDMLRRAGPSAVSAALAECTDEKLPVTALGLAAKQGRLRIVEALLAEFGAPVNARAAHSGYTALSLAAHAGHAAVVSALLARAQTPWL